MMSKNIFKAKVYYCDNINYMINPKPPTPTEFNKHWHKLPFEIEAASLEDVFVKLNTFHGLTLNQRNQLREFAKKVKHTSMSVGDIVEVDGTFYMCDTEGWRRVW